MDIKKKQKLLEVVAEEIEQCPICKKNTIGKAVPGEGNADADIMFIGEAPGKNEAETGRPFIGRAGKMLREGIAQIGLSDQDVFITSPVKRLPVHTTPTPEEIAHGKTHLIKQFDIIDPKVIVLLGRVAALAMLEKNISVMKEHGKFFRKPDGRLYMIMMHPAAPLYSGNLREVFFKDFKKLKKLLDLDAKAIKK
ncbi:MAG: uracil glycosylase superfamily, polymerase bacteriophage-type [Candidatus Doudnabacteria bacterium]|nr:uracil glycosylase superfamily, polymerase bacteriophage-type [Candidatus Doudnabacteria bacterium]